MVPDGTLLIPTGTSFRASIWLKQGAVRAAAVPSLSSSEVKSAATRLHRARDPIHPGGVWQFAKAVGSERDLDPTVEGIALRIPGAAITNSLAQGRSTFRSPTTGPDRPAMA